MVVAYLDFASECEIHDKMLVGYGELTCGWVNSQVAKSQFYS